MDRVELIHNALKLCFVLALYCMTFLDLKLRWVKHLVDLLGNVRVHSSYRLVSLAQPDIFWRIDHLGPPSITRAVPMWWHYCH